MSGAGRRLFRQYSVCLAFIFLFAAIAFAGDPDVIKASRHDVSLPLSQMAIGASINGGGNAQGPKARSTGAMINNPHSDPVAAPLAGPLTGHCAR